MPHNTFVNPITLHPTFSLTLSIARTSVFCANILTHLERSQRQSDGTKTWPTTFSPRTLAYVAVSDSGTNDVIENVSLRQLPTLKISIVFNSHNLHFDKAHCSL